MTEKILIISPSWIGDCVMAQPLFTVLRQKYPDLILDVFAPKWSMAVIRRMPEVDDVIENPFGHGDIKLGLRYQVAGQLKKNNYTQAIVLPGSLKSALLPFFARIPKRTGYIGEMRHILLNDIYELDEQKLPMMVDRFVALAYPKKQEKNWQSPQPALCINPASQLQALKQFNLNTDKPIIAFCPGAEYGPAKRWPTRHFARLAQMYEQKGCQIWLFGSAKDGELAEEIINLSGLNCVNLCGKTNLDEAIDLLAYSQLVICNDSGLMHVSAALGLPLIAIYGSSSPDHTPPLSPLAKIISLNLDCSPCFERICPLGHTNCLENLNAQIIYDIADKELKKEVHKDTANAQAWPIQQLKS